MAQFDDIPLLPAPIPSGSNNHYKSLSDILKDDPTGTPNTAHQPTLIDRENISAVKLASKKGDSHRCTVEGVKAIAGTVREAIKCSECDKPRLIYSKDYIETNELLPLLGFDYTCGGSFLPDSHPKATLVGTLANLECWKPISTAYYSTYKSLSNRNVELMRFAKLCYICGIAGDTIEERQPLTSSSSVLSFISPTCLECHQKGQPNCDVLKRIAINKEIHLTRKKFELMDLKQVKRASLKWKTVTTMLMNLRIRSRRFMKND